MVHVHYSYLRGIELSGRPLRDDGEWLVNVQRLRHGEGEPSPEDPDFRVEVPESGDYRPAPRISTQRLRPFRQLLYRRLRSSADAERFYQYTGWSFQACMHVFPSWANPENGYIPMPKQGDKPVLDTHCVPIGACFEKERIFRFKNSWGVWGLNGNGTGFIHYEYFDRFGFESWGQYFVPHLETHHEIKSKDCRIRRWVVRDEWSRRIYGFQILHPTDDERWAWAFILETKQGLEMEEFYVLPDYRRRGHAKRLIEQIQGLIKAKQSRLYVWMPFAETKQEAPKTFEGLLAVSQRLGLKFQQCPFNWAAYLGGTHINGPEVPIEPSFMPSRPKSIHDLVLAAALALMPAMSTINDTQAVMAQSLYPEVTTGAWEAMNRLRGKLIHKKNREGLTESETVEFDKLQHISLYVLNKTYPSADAHEAMLKEIEDELRTGESS